jgi:hypothetical protein
MPPQRGASARLVCGIVSRFWLAASSPRKIGIARCATARTTLLCLFAGVCACAAYGTPAFQAVSPAVNSPAKAPATTDDTKQPPPTVSDETKQPASDQKDAPSQEPAPSSTQGVSSRTFAPATEPGQTYIELRYNVDGTDIQGNKQRSFLHPGINHTAEFSFFTNEKIGERYRFEMLAVGRYTNNPQVDPERNSIQRAYLRLGGPGFEVNLGDALINFSRMTFNQNVKGLTLSKKLRPGLKFIGTVGFFVDRWGSLYRDYTVFRDLTGPPNPLAPGKPYTRFVAGTRVEQQIGRGSWIALNWSHGKDLQQSLPEGTLACVDPTTGVITIEMPVSAGCTPPPGSPPGTPPGTEIPGFRRPFSEATNNDVLSVDTAVEYTPWHFGMRGEFAYSWTSGGTPPLGADASNFACAPTSPIFGAAVLDSRCFTGQAGDWAGRIEAHQRIKKLTMRTDYARYEPNFFSANARQIRDLQDFIVRGEYELTRSITVIGQWRRSNDNLNGQLASLPLTQPPQHFTHVVRAPEGRLVLRDLPFYRRMTVEMGYRERNLDTPGTPGPLDVQKRSTRIPFISVIVPSHLANISFDYEHRHEINAVTPAFSTDVDRFAIGYRAHYTWDRWEFSPMARFEIERLDKHAPIDPALSPTDINLLFPQDFFFAFDTNRTVQAGFVLDTPRYFRIEGNYKEFNGLALSPLQANSLPQMPFLYFNQGFKRPSWRGALTYKIGNDENRTITFYYLRTNNFFPLGDPTAPNRSFRETVIGGSIVLRFRK